MSSHFRVKKYFFGHLQSIKTYFPHHPDVFLTCFFLSVQMGHIMYQLLDRQQRRQAKGWPCSAQQTLSHQQTSAGCSTATRHMSTAPCILSRDWGKKILAITPAQLEIWWPWWKTPQLWIWEVRVQIICQSVSDLFFFFTFYGDLVAFPGLIIVVFFTWSSIFCRSLLVTFSAAGYFVDLGGFHLTGSNRWDLLIHISYC